MAALPPDLRLQPLGGEPRTALEQLKLFHLAVVVLDPYTHESSWIIDTAGRILTHFFGADCRVGWVVTADEAGAQQFLGPWARQLLTFVDPDRELVKALGLTQLPAFIHIQHDLQVAGRAEGWDPETWREVAESLARDMSWSSSLLPRAGDPTPFVGTPALG